jgi:hypothetical protein
MRAERPAADARSVAVRRKAPAFYTLAPGGWRDYVSLLHPPYTAWHLSYVVFGAVTATRFDGGHLGASVVGFFLGVGLTAHALDELTGRPLRTRISDRTLKTIALLALVAAVALGVGGAVVVSWWLLGFVAFGAFIVLAYNLELFGGWFHSDLWFAVAWGALPALTGAFAQQGRLPWAALPVAGACLLLSSAQRRLSSEVRMLRRRTRSVEGRIVLDDGREVEVTEAMLRAAPESALQILAVALSLLAVGLALARLA